MTRRAAIILAGGKAKRFQTSEDSWQDKALAELNGKPLLIHATENIQDIVDEIIVVVNQNETRISRYKDVFEKYHIQKARIVTDLKIKNLSGPLIAILTGLKSTEADYCITIPCDVPMLNRKVAQYLFDEINGSFVAVPMWPNGRLETLLMVLERKNTLEIANALGQLGRSHPDDIIRGSLKTLFVSPLGQIKTLDPEFRSFVNINCQEDLNRLIPHQGQGPNTENIQLDQGFLSFEDIRCLALGSSKRNSSDFWEASKIFSDAASNFERKGLFFWAALSREFKAKSLLSVFDQSEKHELIKDITKSLLKATQNYWFETKIYEEKGCYLLAERATADKSWCESQIEKLSFK
jgi:molybdenum cofactor guanylyltransferase